MENILELLQITVVRPSKSKLYVRLGEALHNPG